MSIILKKKEIKFVISGISLTLAYTSSVKAAYCFILASLLAQVWCDTFL